MGYGRMRCFWFRNGFLCCLVEDSGCLLVDFVKLLLGDSGSFYVCSGRIER